MMLTAMLWLGGALAMLNLGLDLLLDDDAEEGDL